MKNKSSMFQTFSIRAISAATAMDHPIIEASSEFFGHYSPEFTEEVYVYQEEKIYDCSVLCEIWEISRPPNEKNELLVPLSDSDYYALLA